MVCETDRWGVPSPPGVHTWCANQGVRRRNGWFAALGGSWGAGEKSLCPVCSSKDIQYTLVTYCTGWVFYPPPPPPIKLRYVKSRLGPQGHGFYLSTARAYEWSMTSLSVCSCMLVTIVWREAQHSLVWECLPLCNCDTLESDPPLVIPLGSPHFLVSLCEC